MAAAPDGAMLKYSGDTQGAGPALHHRTTADTQQEHFIHLLVYPGNVYFIIL